MACFFIQSMKLQLQQLLPDFFDPSVPRAGNIWRQDLDIEPGEWVNIVAPSGSGKTSLINFLYGIRKDYKGTIRYDNRPLREFNASELAQLRSTRLSIIFQDLRLFPSQTVRQNLEIKRQLASYHPASVIDEMADKLGISHKLNSPCSTCSYGEQQRTAIIRALLQPFEILLMDEPFSHLDNANARKAMLLILEECKLRGATLVFAELERIDFFPATRFLNL